MIAIVDYGMGNLRSVQKAFEQVGYYPVIVNSAQKLRDAEAIVLPGVGAFADAMHNLQQLDLIEALLQGVKSGKPFLGICLGMQLLFSYSEEWGQFNGLDLLPGAVRKIPAGVKIPHIGWNQIDICRQTPLLAGIEDHANFYFVHSYYVDAADSEHVLATTEYQQPFTSVAGKDNLFGIQFHPEKSSKLGLQILKNFGSVIKKC